MKVLAPSDVQCWLAAVSTTFIASCYLKHHTLRNFQGSLRGSRVTWRWRVHLPMLWSSKGGADRQWDSWACYHIRKFDVGKDLANIDVFARQIDETSNKSKFGANAIVGISMACTRAGAAVQMTCNIIVHSLILHWQFHRTSLYVSSSVSSSALKSHISCSFLSLAFWAAEYIPETW